MKITILVIVCIFLLLTSCRTDNSQELSKQDISKIKKEIINRVDQYFEAVKVLDIEEMVKYWSDSEDFIIAGDGKIIGGYKEWTDQQRAFASITDHYIFWENKNINVEVLSRNAACYTMEFNNGRISTSGDTLNTKGAWTYVFKKYNGDWKVIQTNGAHIEY